MIETDLLPITAVPGLPCVRRWAGGELPPATARSWARLGRQRGGLKLETLRLGNCVYTTREAVEAFLRTWNRPPRKPRR